MYHHLTALHQTEDVSSSLNVCVGKEWHRFPSSFFLPDHKVWTLKFVESEFRGQLPQPFASDSFATRIVRNNFNDLNREEIDRYVDPSQCDYLIDSDYPNFSNRDRPYSQMKDIWQVMYSSKFLNADQSSVWLRAFYIPILSERYCSFIDYNLLRNKRIYDVKLQKLN